MIGISGVASQPSPRIFPTLQGVKWIPADLDMIAAHDFPAPGENPLVDPELCANWINALHGRLGGLTFGGYLELRSRLWRGHYHDPKVMRHWGTDYNVPAGTPVAAPRACTIVRINHGTDWKGGWGTQVFALLDEPYRNAEYFLYGHLTASPPVKEGDRLRPGDIMGIVGGTSENGGWFPHLHVQCFDDEVRREYAPAIEDMDGYGPNTVTYLPQIPDPTPLCAMMN